MSEFKKDSRESRDFIVIGNTIKFKYINPKAKLKALTLNMTEDNELIQKLLALKPEDREPILNYIALHGKDLDMDTSSDLQKVYLNDKSTNSIYEKKQDLEKRKQFLEQAQKKLEAIKDRDEQQNRQLEDIKNEKQMIINELNSLNIGNISTASISSVGNLLISNIKTFDQLTDQLKKWFGENGQLTKDFKAKDLPSVLKELEYKIKTLTDETTEQKKVTESLNTLSEQLTEFIKAAQNQDQQKAKELLEVINQTKKEIGDTIGKLNESTKKIDDSIDKLLNSNNINEIKNLLNKYVERNEIPEDVYTRLDEQIHFDKLMEFYDNLINNKKQYYFDIWFGRARNENKKDPLRGLDQDIFEEYYLPFDLNSDLSRSKVFTTNDIKNKEKNTNVVPNIYIKAFGDSQDKKHPTNFFKVVESIYNIHKNQKSSGLKDWLTSKNVKSSISKQDERQSRSEARITHIESMIEEVAKQQAELRRQIKEIAKQNESKPQISTKPNFLAPSASQRSWLNDVMNFSKNKLNKVDKTIDVKPSAQSTRDSKRIFDENDLLNKVFERRKDIEPDEYTTSEDDWID